jgi:hypothetical protein
MRIRTTILAEEKRKLHERDRNSNEMVVSKLNWNQQTVTAIEKANKTK